MIKRMIKGCPTEIGCPCRWIQACRQPGDDMAGTREPALLSTLGRP
jgi:hypothetical protein